jgi:hypothetical protein
MSRTLLSLAGFQVIISGRFWVIAEDKLFILALADLRPIWAKYAESFLSITAASYHAQPMSIKSAPTAASSIFDHLFHLNCRSPGTSIPPPRDRRSVVLVSFSGSAEVYQGFAYPDLEKDWQVVSFDSEAGPILRMISGISIHFTIGSEPSSRFSNFPVRAYNLPTDLTEMGQHFATSTCRPS